MIRAVWRVSVQFGDVLYLASYSELNFVRHLVPAVDLDHSVFECYGGTVQRKQTKLLSQT